MGANNEDFFNQVFYHGTVHPFKPGDTVDPAKASYGLEARATPDLDYAAHQAAFKEIGARRVAKRENEEAPSGKVFEVRPISGDADKPWEQPKRKTGTSGNDFLVSGKGLEIVREVPVTLPDDVGKRASVTGHRIGDKGEVIKPQSLMTSDYYTDKINGQTRHHFVTNHPDLGEVGHTTILEHSSGVHPIIQETVHNNYEGNKYGDWVKAAALSAAKVRHGLNPVSWDEFSQKSQ